MDLGPLELEVGSGESELEVGSGASDATAGLGPFGGAEMRGGGRQPDCPSLRRPLAGWAQERRSRCAVFTKREETALRSQFEIEDSFDRIYKLTYLIHQNG